MKKELKMKLGANELIIKTGTLAKQANAAVVVQCQETIVLVSAVMSRQTREDIDFLPLTVEYQERTYAAGRIPGGFFKREGKPSEKEILTARLIDRPIRPLFPQGLRNEVQIVAIVLSSDGENDPDILALIGASAALHISDIPFEVPLAAVKVAQIDGKFIINPTYKEVEGSKFNIIVAGSKNGIVMIESEAKEISEELFHEALDFGYKALLPLIELQEQLRKECGKKKREVALYSLPVDVYTAVREIALDKIKNINLLSDKDERIEALDSLVNELDEKFKEKYSALDIREALAQIQREEVRKYTANEKKRVDGRSFEDLRAISCEAGILPRTHGSALFTRGQTQSLAVVTLGTTVDEQKIDSLAGESYKKFMLHYNFPPFSVGETKPMRGPGRRELGHGALAEKSLKAVMPEKELFPYTVRIVSDILESNGSSSMATVCSGSIALMDSGVPIKNSVSGVALGLFKDGDKEAILTDIAGLEDHYGDMDFKVAGTRNGITSVQMDLKIKGISLVLISLILKQSKRARIKILDIMDSVISVPKDKVSSYAPRLTSFQLPADKVGLVIGPGGKTIKRIISETGAKFDIDDAGMLNIAADNDEQLQIAIEKIKELIQDAEVGMIYNGKITKIMNFGAFCEILPNKEGLIHVSEIANKFVSNVEDFLKVGDEVKVKVLGIDEVGKIKLSIKHATDEASEG